MGDAIFRTAPDRIELYLDKRATTVQTIRIESSSALTAWATVASVSSKDQPANSSYGDAGYRGKVYFRFNPTDYARTYPFFLRFVDVAGGVDGAISGPVMAIDPIGQKSVLEISGTAPNGAAVANSIHLTLPPTLRIRIDNVNGAATSLKMALDNTGPERTIAQNGSFSQEGRFTDLYLRGDGATCDFLLQMVLWELPK